MQYVRESLSFFRGRPIAAALREAVVSPANERVDRVTSLYSAVTGSAEVQRLEGLVEEQYTALRQSRGEFQRARHGLEAARAAFEDKKAEHAREIHSIERDAGLDVAERESFITRLQRELRACKENRTLQEAQQAVRGSERAMEDHTDAYVEALALKHRVESKWNNARSVLVTLGSVVSVIGGLVLTPVVTMATTAYRINKSVDLSLAKGQATMQQELLALLGQHQQQTVAAVSEQQLAPAAGPPGADAGGGGAGGGGATLTVSRTDSGGDTRAALQRIEAELARLRAASAATGGGAGGGDGGSGGEDGVARRAEADMAIEQVALLSGLLTFVGMAALKVLLQ